MVILRCDACGAEVPAAEAVAVAVGRSRTLDALTFGAASDRHSAQFEFCSECAAAFILACKTCRAGAKRGEGRLAQ